MKTQAINGGKSNIDTPTATSEEYTVDSARLNTEIVNSSKEVSEDGEALNNATALRTKQSAMLIATEKDKFQSIGNMMHAKVVESNYHIGPWQGGAYWKETTSMTRDLATNFDENHEVVLSTWPEVCRRHGWVLPEDTDAAARRRWLDGLPAQTFLNQCPP